MPLPMVPPPITPAVLISIEFPKAKPYTHHGATASRRIRKRSARINANSGIQGFVLLTGKPTAKGDCFSITNLPTYSITKFSGRTILSSPRNRQELSLFLKRERCLDARNLNNVTFLQLSLAGKV